VHCKGKERQQEMKKKEEDEKKVEGCVVSFKSLQAGDIC
jgi:hypothetical protein